MSVWARPIVAATNAVAQRRGHDEGRVVRQERPETGALASVFTPTRGRRGRRRCERATM